MKILKVKKKDVSLKSVRAMRKANNFVSVVDARTRFNFDEADNLIKQGENILRNDPDFKDEYAEPARYAIERKIKYLKENKGK